MATREKEAVFGPELFSFLVNLRANNDFGGTRLSDADALAVRADGTAVVSPSPPNTGSSRGGGGTWS